MTKVTAKARDKSRAMTKVTAKARDKSRAMVKIRARRDQLNITHIPTHTTSHVVHTY